MSIQRLTLALVVAVVILAGCAVQSSDVTSDATDTPPGVEDDTLSNATALLDAHTETLSETGFVVRETTNASYREDGRTVSHNSSMRYAAEPGLDSFHVQPGRERSDYPAVWANETVVLASEERANGTTYSRPPRNWTPPAMLSGAQSLARFFAFGTYSLTGTASCDGRSCVVLEANGSSSDRVRNFTGTVLVDSRGVVHEARFAYDRVADDRTYRTRHRFDLLRTGEGVVERPAWVEEALERT